MFTAASVWIILSDLFELFRPKEDTMPAVTVLSIDKGYPIARTHLPIKTDLDSPYTRKGSLTALILRIARSVKGSVPITVALYIFLLLNITTMSDASFLLLSAITWL